jgi:glycosyltransferase involved in cell wall biosynthesis
MLKTSPGRVLMTTDAVGGVWQYSLELSSGLGRRGVRVLLAAMGPAPSAVQLEAAGAIRGLALLHRPFRLEWMAGVEADLDASAAWLADLEAAFEPNIVQINGYAHACLPWRCPVVVVCHSCVCSWWRAVRGGELPREWDAYGARAAAALRAADLVIAPTRAFLHTVQAIYGIRLPAACAIPNGRGGPFRGGDAKEPLVFSCGRAWDEAKGLDRIDRLAARLPWPVFVAGSMQGMGGSDSRAPAHARMLGSLREDELASWLAAASVFVLPARYEPFGLAILEAAMSSCALVLGNLDTLRELWDGAAQFVDARDEDALRASVIDLIRDPLLCRQMGDRARERARRYTAERMVEGYVQAYRRASRRSTARGGTSIAAPVRRREIGLHS